MSRRRLLIEWITVATALAVLVVALTFSQALLRLDATLHDLAVRLAGRPAHPDLVIVGVDEASLAALGRWPWSRHTHARLLDRLTEAGAGAVALDILFSEADGQDPAADRRLRTAIARHGRVVLALHMDVARGEVRAILPAETVRGAVRLGHVNAELDPDGVARRVFLREGPGGAAYPHLALALLESVGRAPVVLPGERARGDFAPDAWARDWRYPIPFAGPPGHVPTLSYIDVLEGRVDAARLRGRLVLVGATAIGIKDALPTPVSGESAGMPGVEIVANVADGLLQERYLRVAGPAATALVCVLLVLVPLATFLRLGPRASLVLTLAWTVLVVATALLAPRIAQVWVAPACALVGLALAYPAWSWRRLQATYDDLRAEIDMLGHAAAAVAIAVRPPTGEATGLDPVQRRMVDLQRASARLRSLKRFVTDALDGMSDAVLITDGEANVLLANARAVTLFSAARAQDLLGRRVDALLAGWEQPAGFDPNGLAGAGPVRVRSRQGHPLLVAAAPCALEQGPGTVFTFTDITALDLADARRREALAFVSHDLRAPLSGILALVELERGRDAGDARVLGSIESATRRALAMADDFTAIARAGELRPAAFAPVDLVALAEESIDLVHARARRRSIAIRLEAAPPEAMVDGDPGLLRRALVNVLQNALQHAPPDSLVAVRVEPARAGFRVSVRDQGPGIAPADLERVFERFQRGAGAAHAHPAGAGLGLALVRAVASGHGGVASAVNAQGGGAEISLTLPARPADG